MKANNASFNIDKENKEITQNATFVLKYLTYTAKDVFPKIAYKSQVFITEEGGSGRKCLITTSYTQNVFPDFNGKKKLSELHQ